MKRLAFVVVALLALSFQQALAQDRTVEDVSQRAYELASDHARCAGYWDWWSDLEDALGRPASAEYARNLGNGARLTAGYLLSMRHTVMSPAATPRTYGSWDQFIEPLAEVTATTMQANLESGNSDVLAEQMRFCGALSESSQPIIDDIRQQMTDAPQR
jgi:hypothetical protein